MKEGRIVMVWLDIVVWAKLLTSDLEDDFVW